MTVDNTELAPQKRTLIRESGKVVLLMGLGVATKMAAEILIAGRFGLSAQTDAFFVAYTLPLIIEALVFTACQLGLVPILVRAIGPEQAATKWALFSTLLNLSALVSLALVILGMAGAPWLAALLAPGVEHQHRQLIYRLMRILFLGTLVVGPVGVMRAMLNAHHLFAAPAAVDLIRGMAMLGAILVAPKSYGIEAVAWGFVAGCLVQCAVLAGAILRKLGAKYRPTMRLGSLQAAQTGRFLVVPFADYALVQAVIIVERMLGSFMPAGSITAISFGRRLSSSFGNLLFDGVGVVSLSALSSDFAQGTESHLERAKQTFATSLRFVWLLGIPAAVCIWFLRFPITRLVFERGAFDRQATALAAPVLGIYALAIPFYGYWLLLKNYQLAALQSKRVLALSAIGTVVNIALALVLARPAGAQGVALAYVAGLGSVFGLGTLALRREYEYRHQTTSHLAIKVLGASILVGLVSYGITEWLSRLLGQVLDLPSFVLSTASLLIAGLSWGTLLAGALLVLQIDEATTLLRYVKRTGLRIGKCLVR
jgi:putative peptidoglycan lipid II flippase